MLLYIIPFFIYNDTEPMNEYIYCNKHIRQHEINIYNIKMLISQYFIWQIAFFELMKYKIKLNNKQYYSLKKIKHINASIIKKIY